MEEPEKFLLFIREARAEDAEEMVRLRYETWLATYPNKRHGITRADIEHEFADKLTEEGLAEVANDLEKLEMRRMVLVGLDLGTGKMVAMCRALKSMRRGEPNKLCALYVIPDYQSCGVGRAMWNYISIKHLDPSACTLTYVAQYNTRAIKFYTKKLGFVRTDSPTLRDPRWKMQSGNIIPDIELCLKAQTAP
jgi:ribosomal protein S18 acetylase RimI-like enzyme